MATVYCRSGAGGTGDGSSWTNAYTTLAAALTGAGSGGTVYVAHDHDNNSSAANIALTSPGTAAAPVTIICGDDAAEPPTTLATTGVERTTGNYGITFQGYAVCYGMSFTTSSAGGSNSAADLNFNANADTGWVLDTCTLTISSTNAGALVVIGGANQQEYFIRFVNTTVNFGATGQYFDYTTGTFVWENSTANAVGGTIPTTKLVNLNINGRGGRIHWSGLDLDQVTGAGSYLFSATGDCHCDVRLENCKLGAVITTLASGTAISGPGSVRIFIDNSDSGDTNYRFDHRKYQGSIVSATNCTLNAGYSMKMTPITGASIFTPLRSLEFSKWYTTTGSQKTATVEIIHNEAAALKDNEIWLQIDYLGTASLPLASSADDKCAFLATAADQTTSTASWTEDLAGQIKQKLAVTFTPQKAGYVTARVHLAKVTSNPVYVDPVITIA